MGNVHVNGVVFCRLLGSSSGWAESVLLPAGVQNLPQGDSEMAIAKQLLATLCIAPEELMGHVEAAEQAATRQEMTLSHALALKLHVPVCYAGGPSGHTQLLGSEAAQREVSVFLGGLALADLQGQNILETPERAGV